MTYIVYNTVTGHTGKHEALRTTNRGEAREVLGALVANNVNAWIETED